MGDVPLIQLRTLMILLLTYAQSATFIDFKLSPAPNHRGQIELVCDIADIDNNQWVAIYRYFGHYAECIFWEQAHVTNGPFSCTGDFQVSVTRAADKNVKYKVVYNLPISSPNEGDYFCRVLSIAGNGEYVLEKGAFEHGTQNAAVVRQAGEYIDNGNFPLCSPKTPKTSRYSAGDSIELSCTALGNVPATVQWKRNQNEMHGYPKIFHHGVDPGRSEIVIPTSNTAEFYNKDGYILVTTKINVTLTEADELNYFTCEMSSPSPTAQKCTFGPFILEGSGETDSACSGNCTDVSSGTVLGLDIWLFTTIAGVIIGILIVSNLVVSVCLYKAKKKSIYMVRKGSQHPILQAHEETEMEHAYAYDSSRHNGGQIAHIGGYMAQNGGNTSHIGGHMAHNGGHTSHTRGHMAQNGGHTSHTGGHMAYNGGHTSRTGGHMAHNEGHTSHTGGHMTHNVGRPHTDVTNEDNTNESPYSPYPPDEFDDDYGPENDEPMYGNTGSQTSNNQAQPIYDNY